MIGLGWDHTDLDLELVLVQEEPTCRPLADQITSIFEVLLLQLFSDWGQSL